MAKYIKCEAVLELIRPDDPNDERCAVTVATAKRLIRHALTVAPAADVAPVTRCKDCKYLRVWNQKDLYAFCPKTNFVFLPFQADTRTHFCSYGEPKEVTC